MRSYVPSRLFAVLVVVFHTLSVCSAQSCGAAPEGTLRLVSLSTFFFLLITLHVKTAVDL